MEHDAYYVEDVHEDTTTKVKAQVYRFHGVDAALAFGNAIKSLSMAPRAAVNAGYQARRVPSTDRKQDSPEWCEGMSDAACYAAATAPTDAKQRLMDDASAVSSFDAPMAPQARRRLVKRLDDGDVIDAERYAVEFTIEGVWQRRIRTAKPTPTLRIAINGAAHCGQTAQNMARAGAAILSVVKAAEDNGYAVEVDWCLGWDSPCGKVHSVTLVPLKRVDQAIDWSTLVGFTVGGSTFRTLGFDMIIGVHACDVGTCLGYPRHVDASVFGHDIASPSVFRSDADARKWVEEAQRILAAKAQA